MNHLINEIRIIYIMILLLIINSKIRNLSLKEKVTIFIFYKFRNNHTQFIRISVYKITF